MRRHGLSWFQIKKLLAMLSYVARNYGGVILTAVRTLSNHIIAQRSPRISPEDLQKAIEHLKATGSMAELEKLLSKLG